MASKSRRLGFDQPFPLNQARTMGRQFGTMNTTALALARRTMKDALESGDPRVIGRALDRFAMELPATMPDVRGITERSGKRIDRAHRKLFLDAVTRTVRAPIISPDTPVVEVGARAGAKPLLLPGNIEPGLAADILVGKAELLMVRLQAGIVEGMRQRIAEVEDPAELLDEWADFGMPSRVGERVENVASHAMLIANDQVGTMFEQMTRSRQQSVGITEFVWRSRRDGKVREQHVDWDGQVFTWAQGAPGGVFPGGPINCRCRAQALVDPTVMRGHLQQLEAA